MTLPEYACKIVQGMSLAEIRAAMSTIRNAKVEYPDSFWLRYMPVLGIHISTFCVGYVLRSRRSSVSRKSKYPSA
jgi:hypothetical protein